MGLLSWVGETVADGLYAKGDIESDAISARYNTIADTVDVIGDCIETAAEVANDAIGFTGDVAEATLDVAGDIVEGAADLVGDAINLSFDWIGKGIQGTTDVGGDILDSVFSFLGAEKLGAAINNSLDSMGTTVADGMDGLGDTLNQTAEGLGKFTNTLADAAGKGTNALLDATGDAIEIVGKGTNLGLDIVAKSIKFGGMVLSNIVRFSYAKKAFFAAAIVGSPKAKCIWTRYVSDTAGSLAGGIFEILGVENSLANKTKKDPCDGEKLDTKACGGSASGPISEKCQGNANIDSVYYVNGINTTKKTGETNACKTAKQLSRSTCSKVTGIYNATEGIGTDLRECIDNIKRNSEAPATATLHTEIIDKLLNDPPDKVIIFAHSQGGLITQEALERVRTDLIFFYDDGTPEGTAEVEKRLAMIEVKSFGTATNGWIKGPSYEHYTNNCDPVPKIIQNIQNKMSCYDDKSKFDDTPTHRFNDCEYWNPIAPHSMDDVYINEYVMQHGACKC